MTRQLSQTALYGEILSNEWQFQKDIAAFQMLTSEQEEVLLQRVKKGDEQARQEMITSFLPFLSKCACLLLKSLRAKGYAVHRLDFLDVVQVGSLAIVEKINHALEKENPFAWLVQAARGVMYRYCVRHESIISISDDATHSDSPKVESLNAPVFGEEEEITYADFLTDNSFVPEPEHDYQHIERAIQKLSPRKQTIIIRHYGLFGETCEELKDIQLDIYKKPGTNTVSNYRNEALMQLYDHLVPEYPHCAGNGSPLLQKKPRRTVTQWLTCEQIERLEQAIERLQVQGQKVTTTTLQREAHMKSDYVKSYLYQQKQAHPEPDRFQKLEQAIAQMKATGQRVTIGALVKEAHVAREHVSAYLRQCASA